MIIAGGRTHPVALYGPGTFATGTLPKCSRRAGLQHAAECDQCGVAGPADRLSSALLPTDVLYACGAPGMVDTIKSIAAHNGAICYADPFMPAADATLEDRVLKRAVGWLAAPSSRQTSQLAHDRHRNRQEPPMQSYRIAEAGCDVIVVLRALSLHRSCWVSTARRSCVLYVCGVPCCSALPRMARCVGSGQDRRRQCLRRMPQTRSRGLEGHASLQNIPRHAAQR